MLERTDDGRRCGLTRIVLAVTAAVLLSGCWDHTMEWPGVRAEAHTLLLPGPPTYHSVSWTQDLASGPGFSVALSDGRTITAIEFTAYGLRARGAKGVDPTSGTLVDSGSDPPDDIGRPQSLRIEIGDYSSVAARFDENGLLTRIRIYRSSDDEEMRVGDRQGSRWLSLPATRAELIELFGEPITEVRRNAVPRCPFGGFNCS